MISEQVKQRMRDLASRYPVARSAILPALHLAQQEEGYITDEGTRAVAEAIGITTSDVESIATFYTMYYQQQPGKRIIKVCNSISCYLRNCDELIEHLSNRLGIKPGETSADGNYTLLTVECLASCGTAPVLQVNDEFVENVSLEKADQLLADLNNELSLSPKNNVARVEVNAAPTQD